MAIYFREDCRTLRDSLQLEMVVAQYCLQIRDVRTTAGVPGGDAVGVGVVAELEGHGDPLSHAILHGLAHVGAGEMAKRSAAAAARLGERGIGLPEEFADVGQATALGAWRTDAGGFEGLEVTEAGLREGEYALFADFEHPRGVGHAVALFVDPRRGGVVKHLGLLSPISEMGPGDPFHPEAMETVGISAAGAQIGELLERSYGESAVHSDDFRVLIATARTSSMVPEGVAAGPGAV